MGKAISLNSLAFLLTFTFMQITASRNPSNALNDQEETRTFQN